MRTLGATLRGLRELRKLTQAQLAERSGCSQGNISRIEQDAISTSAATVEALAAALGCDVDTVYLCRRELE